MPSPIVTRFGQIIALMSGWLSVIVLTPLCSGAPDGADARPEPGQVHTESSRVYTFVEKKGLGHPHAIEGQVASGALLLGAQSNAGRLVFDMQSFDADTLRARRYLGLEGASSDATRSQVNANMRGVQVLAVTQFPTAIFQVDSAVASGRRSQRGLPVYELSGTFTLHGVSKPIRVPVDIERRQGWLHVRGTFAVRQTDFDITPFTKAFGAIGIADQLVIHGDLWVAPNDHLFLTDIPERQ